MSNGSVDNNIPEHISIIMDGNGRWAQRNSLPRIAGSSKYESPRVEPFQLVLLVP